MSDVYQPGLYAFRLVIDTRDPRIGKGVIKGRVEIQSPISYYDMVNLIHEMESRRSDRDPMLFQPGSAFYADLKRL